MTADLITLLWHATLASSVAIMLVLALRKPLRFRFGAQVAYSAWLFVPVAIGVALIPAPIDTQIVAPLPLHATPSTASSSMPIAPLAASSIDVEFWLSCAWLGGIALWTLWLAYQQRRFLIELGRLERYGDNAWRAQNVTSCPALIGAWRPRIVLPQDFDERYTAIERALILAHERTHVARADAALNLGVSALRCVFWFNPLLHAAAARFRFDQELACDAAVIAHFPEARRPYADAMLKTQLADIGLPVGCHWQSSHPLKERISMLKSSLPSPRRKRIGVALSAVFIIGVAAAAWAEQPKRLAQPTPDAGDISTELRIKIDGHNLDGWTFNADGHDRSVHESSDYSTFTMNLPSGHAFNIKLSRGSDVWQIAATPEATADGTLRFAADLSHNGADFGHPLLLAKANEPAGIKIGEESAEGSFKGFEAQITMTSAPSALQASTADPAPHATYRSISRIDYPAAQAKAGIGGIVFVVAHVASDGHVVSTSLKAGPGNSPDVSPLVTAALAGVQRWKFNPAQRDGKPMPSDEIVPVVFEGPNRANTANVPGALEAISVRVPQSTAEAAPIDQAPNEDVNFRMSRPPKYPTAAIKAHQSGKIVLKVLISESGEPLSAAVETATPPEAEAIFADDSISAVMQWRFNPGLRDGKPYEGYALVPFTYSLTDDDEESASPQADDNRQ
jgi:bla regulator protein BlaR1